ncbi:MAG TPA: LysR substrate-binding domain-containing protein [Xanthomonadales bacterium]|nr:LysR substrate-binding domain-containing protein [Xanthomonadales bacterium]
MNLRDLKYLVALADHKHFGRAAEASFASQPTLSTQIKKLEDELDVQIFERQPRSVLLTRAGEAIIARARSILREVDAIRDVARNARDPEAGSVRLGMFPTLGPYLLPHVIPALHQRFPRLELLLVEEKSEELLAKLERGDVDAALLALPAGDESLTTAMLFEEPFLLALPRERAAEFPEGNVKLDDLRDQQVLLLEEGHCMRTQALSLCALGGASERRGFRATSLETLRQMVAANVGMTLLPQLSVMPPVAVNDHLLLRRFAEPQPKRQIGLLWRKSDAREPLMQTLAEILVDSARQVLGDPIPADRREDRRR